MSYLIPVADEPDLFVSASWQDHKDRTPPSGEPGTDYACSTGTLVRAAGDGRVSDRKTDNSGAMGRYVALELDDGRTTRTLHMQRVDAPVGARVRRGDALGVSGASGYGSDYYYGPHAHQTLWDGPAWEDPTIDFEKYAEEEDMPITEDDARRIAAHVWAYESEYAHGNNMGYLQRKTFEGVDEHLPVTFTDDQIRYIADQITEQLEVPPISDDDIAKIAKAVNDDAAARLES